MIGKAKVLANHWLVFWFALGQTLRHIGMLAYDYWSVGQSEKNFNAWMFVRRDLARPFFEPYGFCDAWTNYGLAQTAVLGLLRRLGLRQWRSPASSRILRCLLYLLLPFGVLGGLFLLLSAVAILASGLKASVHALGVGLWLVWLGLLAAERLRVWPFARLMPTQPSR